MYRNVLLMSRTMYIYGVSELVEIFSRELCCVIFPPIVTPVNCKESVCECITRYWGRGNLYFWRVGRKAIHNFRNAAPPCASPARPWPPHNASSSVRVLYEATTPCHLCPPLNIYACDLCRACGPAIVAVHSVIKA